ncbi:MAG: hypothetical protein JJE25_08975, partial [Bacteroidia bacterium]|nr:hypothetical protein [Bacteroidia bacterium]
SNAGIVPSAYCTPTNPLGCAGFGDDITNVTFAGINHSSACELYSFITSPAASVTAGVPTFLSVSTGVNNFTDEGVTVWIDFNQDGTFTSGEIVLTGYTGNDPETYTTNVTIPVSALNGTTRMRVACRWASAPTDPCNVTANWGEVEDYNVTISGGTAVSNLPCPGSTWTLDAHASGGGTPYTYTWSGPALSTSTQQVYHIGLSSLVGLVNSCGNGSWYNSCGGTPIGFSWNDIGVGTVQSIQIQFGIGVDCNAPAVSHTTTLNGVGAPSFTPPGNYCNCSPINTPITVNPTTGYNVGGGNTFMMTSGSTCFGFINNQALGADYALVTVTYGADNPVQAQPTTTSVYTIVVTDNCGNTASGTVTANVQDVNIAVTPATTTQCDYESVTLNASGNVSSFSWSPSTGLSSTSGASVVASPSGTTTYTVSGAAGNCTVSATALVNVNKSPIVNPTATPPSVCYNGASQLDGTAHTVSYITWSDNFIAGVPGTATQCTSWMNFAAQLTPQNYTKVTLKGSNDPVGVYIDDPAVVAQIAAAMLGGTNGTWTSNGRTWHVNATCGAGLELGADENSCTCYNPGYEIRPCINNGNWGGIGGGTCSQNFPGTTPSQTMIVEFQVSNTAPTTIYSWTPTGLLDDPSSATPVASGITGTTTWTVSTNIAGCASSASTGSVTVTQGVPVTVSGTASEAAPTGYCVPSVSPNSCIYMFITNVGITGTALNNPSGCSSSSYTLYPAAGSTTAALTAASSYTMTLASIANPMNFTVWIDINKDGVFTADEIVVNNFATQLAATTSFTVPAGALNGATRMRVRADFTGSAPVNNPCSQLTYGETEDYIVTISGGTSAPACPGTSWTLSSSVSGGAIPYTYLWTGAGLVTNNTAVVSAIPPASGDYQLLVTDNCGETASLTVSVSVNDVSVSVTPTSITQCSNQSVVLTASGIGDSFTWSPEDGLSDDEGLVVTANPQVTTLYTVTAHSGICTSSATSLITVNPAPVLLATATPANVCIGGTSQLDAGVVSGAAQAYHIGTGGLINMFDYCGNGSSYYNGCSGNVGVTWTDIGSGSASTLQIQLALGVDCDFTGSHDYYLNGNYAGTFTQGGGYCDCAVRNEVVTINPNVAFYNVGGSNTLMITDNFTCYGLTMGSSLGSDFALVNVAFGGNTLSWTPTTFLDDPSSATPVASNVTATTTYTVATTAENGCTATSSVTVYAEALSAAVTAVVTPVSGDAPTGYCNPTLFPSNGCNYINSVTTSGGITNITTPVDAGYNGTGNTFFSAASVSQVRGSSFTLTVQSQGYCQFYSFYSVWVDWNRNGAFEASEKMVNNVNCNNDATSFTIN